MGAATKVTVGAGPETVGAGALPAPGAADRIGACGALEGETKREGAMGSFDNPVTDAAPGNDVGATARALWVSMPGLPDSCTLPLQLAMCCCCCCPHKAGVSSSDPSARGSWLPVPPLVPPPMILPTRKLPPPVGTPAGSMEGFDGTPGL